MTGGCPRGRGVRRARGGKREGLGGGTAGNLPRKPDRNRGKPKGARPGQLWGPGPEGRTVQAAGPRASGRGRAVRPWTRVPRLVHQREGQTTAPLRAAPACSETGQRSPPSGVGGAGRTPLPAEGVSPHRGPGPGRWPFLRAWCPGPSCWLRRFIRPLGQKAQGTPLGHRGATFSTLSGAAGFSFFNPVLPADLASAKAPACVIVGFVLFVLSRTSLICSLRKYDLL